jgi:hypothetical protein
VITTKLSGENRAKRFKRVRIVALVLARKVRRRPVLPETIAALAVFNDEKGKGRRGEGEKGRRGEEGRSACTPVLLLF